MIIALWVLLKSRGKCCRWVIIIQPQPALVVFVVLIANVHLAIVVVGQIHHGAQKVNLVLRVGGAGDGLEGGVDMVEEGEKHCIALRPRKCCRGDGERCGWVCRGESSQEGVGLGVVWAGVWIHGTHVVCC